MERDEFLAKLISLYPASFSKGNTTEWINAYKQKLNENVDFDLLYNEMLEKHDKVAAPTPAFLFKIAKGKRNTNITNNNCVWENILADIKGITYEFALYCPFGEARTILEGKGFTNVRYPEPITRSY